MIRELEYPNRRHKHTLTNPRVDISYKLTGKDNLGGFDIVALLQDILLK